jgi:gliding motility-associated-like protein
VNVVVKVLGTIPCQNSTSAYVTGCTNSAPQVVTDSITTCTNGSVTFNVQNAASNITYTWYDAATGGNLVFTGNPFAPANLTATTYYWLEHASAAGCTGSPRTRVTAAVLPPLAQAVPVVSSSTANSVTFTWPSVPGASSYQVSVNGGTFGNPSSGATGLTHTVTGLTTLQSTSIVVQAIGALPCQTSNSASVSGCANSPATVVTDSVAVCTGGSATFNVQNPIAGFTYRWYTTSTAGSPLTTGGNFVINATGSTFTVNNISGATSYWVEQVSAGGCVGTPRTRVAIGVYGPLAPAVIVDPVPGADLTPNSITFRWSSVPFAGSYQVSIDNGPWIPANGTLSHTVTGLAPLQQVSIRVKAIGVITCQESISAAVTARTRPDQIYIPNTFTPNGDGVNDILKVYGYVIKEVKFLVFNQWGEKIGEVTNNNMGADGSFTVWDGKYKGSYQPVGVYIYVAKIELKDGTVTERKGALNIVR